MGPHPALLRRPDSLCQLAAQRWNGTVPDGGTWAEPKIDGVRAIYIRGELLTREGVALRGAGHILEALRQLERLAGAPMVFDGEFQVAGDYRATLAHVSSKAPEDAGTLHLFDVLPLDCWEADEDDEPLHRRKAALVALSGEWEAERAAERAAWDWPGHTRAAGPAEPPIAVVRDEWLGSAEEVAARAHEVWAAGGEGLMLKDWSAPYRRSRSDAWRKVKRDGWATRKIHPIG